MNSIIDYALSFLYPGHVYDNDDGGPFDHSVPVASSPLNKIVEARNEVGETVYLEMPCIDNISHGRAAVQPCRVLLN